MQAGEAAGVAPGTLVPSETPSTLGSCADAPHHRLVQVHSCRCAEPIVGVGRSNAITCACRSRFAPLQGDERGESVPAPASSTNENAICVIAKRRRRRFVPGVMRMLPPASPARRRVRRWQRRDVRERDRRGQRETDADPEQVRVDGDVERANGEARGKPRHHCHERTRQQHAQRSAGAAEDETLGEQRATQCAAARAECGRTASSPSRRTDARESGSRRSSTRSRTRCRRRRAAGAESGAPVRRSDRGAA